MSLENTKLNFINNWELMKLIILNIKKIILTIEDITRKDNKVTL